MSVYDERPWLALYGDQPADFEIEFDNALDMFRAGVARDPEGAALAYFDGTVSRRELDELSDALAVGLLANGFSAGDRLAVYLQNVPQFVIAMVATWKAGGVMVSVNPMSRKRELSYLLADSGATVLVSLESLYDEVAREVVPDTDVRLRAHHQRAGVPDPRRRAALRRDEPAAARGHHRSPGVHRASTAGRRRRPSGCSRTTSRS